MSMAKASLLCGRARNLWISDVGLGEIAAALIGIVLLASPGEMLVFPEKSSASGMVANGCRGCLAPSNPSDPGPTCATAA
jgi:hypothetical protein